MTKPTTKYYNKDRAIAAAFTVAFHAALVFVCIFTVLNHGNQAPITQLHEEKENEITFEDVVDFQVGGSYTTPQETIDPQPVLSKGAETPAAPLPAPDPQEIEQQRREEIARKVTFPTNTVSDTKGDSGTKETTTAAPTDINAEVIGFKGFSNEGFPKPQGFSHTGTIAINVTVDATGRIIAATHNKTHSNGQINNDRRAIKACIEAASNSKFKPHPGTSTGSVGTIYYRFKKEQSQ